MSFRLEPVCHRLGQPFSRTPVPHVRVSQSAMATTALGRVR